MPRVVPVGALCSECGAAFQGPISRKTCSLACSLARKDKIALARRLKESALRRTSRPSIAKVCVGCGADFESRQPSKKYCNRACLVRHKARQPYVGPPKVAAACSRCGAAFLKKNPAHRYCSETCAYDVLKERSRSRLRRMAKNAARRARKAGAERESINPMAVFRRDNWRCQICGGKTVAAHRGTNHPLAPELDHRIPLSKGGSHTWDNVQCACRKCNNAKGATVTAGQIPLFAQPA